MRSSSSSDVASRGMANDSPIPSASAVSRRGISRRNQVSAKPSAATAGSQEENRLQSNHDRVDVRRAVPQGTTSQRHGIDGGHDIGAGRSNIVQIASQPVGENRTEQRHADRAAHRTKQHGAGSGDAKVLVVDAVLNRDNQHLHHHAHAESKHCASNDVCQTLPCTDSRDSQNKAKRHDGGAGDSGTACNGPSG